MSENKNNMEELLQDGIDLGDMDAVGASDDPFADINGGNDPFAGIDGETNGFTEIEDKQQQY